jgi:hypothetical protein
MPNPRLRFAFAAVLAALLLIPASAQAATVFGSRLSHQPANSGECNMLGQPCTIVSYVEPEEGTGNPYTGGAPVSGVITKFRIYAYTENPTPVTFVVADVNLPNPGDQDTANVTLAGSGPTVTVQHTEEPSIQEFSGRLPVKKGQQLGIDGTEIQATYNNSGDKFSYVLAPPLAAGGARTSTEPTGELLVQGTIEPDADGDGFGDETQDQCPSQATTQGPCDNTAPSVSGAGVSAGVLSYTLSEASTVTLRLEKKTAGRKVGGKCVVQTKKNRGHARCPRFKPVGAAFSGPGAAGPNKVTLPNGKRLKPGSYRVTITAVDAAGNKTVKTTSFKVKPKRKKH